MEGFENFPIAPEILSEIDPEWLQGVNVDSRPVSPLPEVDRGDLGGASTNSWLKQGRPLLPISPFADGVECDDRDLKMLVEDYPKIRTDDASPIGSLLSGNFMPHESFESVDDMILDGVFIRDDDVCYGNTQSSSVCDLRVDFPNDIMENSIDCSFVCDNDPRIATNESKLSKQSDIRNDFLEDFEKGEDDHDSFCEKDHSLTRNESQLSKQCDLREDFINDYEEDELNKDFIFENGHRHSRNEPELLNQDLVSCNEVITNTSPLNVLNVSLLDEELTFELPKLFSDDLDDIFQLVERELGEVEVLPVGASEKPPAFHVDCLQDDDTGAFSGQLDIPSKSTQHGFDTTFLHSEGMDGFDSLSSDSDFQMMLKSILAVKENDILQYDVELPCVNYPIDVSLAECIPSQSNISVLPSLSHGCKTALPYNTSLVSAEKCDDFKSISDMLTSECDFSKAFDQYCPEQTTTITLDKISEDENHIARSTSGCNDILAHCINAHENIDGFSTFNNSSHFPHKIRDGNHATSKPIQSITTYGFSECLANKSQTLPDYTKLHLPQNETSHNRNVNKKSKRTCTFILSKHNKRISVLDTKFTELDFLLRDKGKICLRKRRQESSRTHAKKMKAIDQKKRRSSRRKTAVTTVNQSNTEYMSDQSALPQSMPLQILSCRMRGANGSCRDSDDSCVPASGTTIAGNDNSLYSGDRTIFTCDDTPPCHTITCHDSPTCNGIHAYNTITGFNDTQARHIVPVGNDMAAYDVSSSCHAMPAFTVISACDTGTVSVLKNIAGCNSNTANGITTTCNTTAVSKTTTALNACKKTAPRHNASAFNTIASYNSMNLCDTTTVACKTTTVCKPATCQLTSVHDTISAFKSTTSCNNTNASNTIAACKITAVCKKAKPVCNTTTSRKNVITYKLTSINETMAACKTTVASNTITTNNSIVSCKTPTASNTDTSCIITSNRITGTSTPAHNIVVIRDSCASDSSELEVSSTDDKKEQLDTHIDHNSNSNSVLLKNDLLFVSKSLSLSDKTPSGIKADTKHQPSGKKHKQDEAENRQSDSRNAAETQEEPDSCQCHRVNIGKGDKFVSVRVRDMWMMNVRDMLRLSGHAAEPKSEKEIARERTAERRAVFKQKQLRLQRKFVRV